MAAISGTLGDGEISATFTPTNGVSDAILEIRSGRARIQCMAPNTSWIDVADKAGAFELATPDAAIVYRVIGGPQCDCDYYIGP